jgi:hypothetical protein
MEKRNEIIIDKRNQFYFEGKYFDTFEEMIKHCVNWADLELDIKTAETHLNHLQREIVLNIFMRGIKFKNAQFKQYLQEIFEFAIEKMPT